MEMNKDSLAFQNIRKLDLGSAEKLENAYKSKYRRSAPKYL
jgi:hypothetical protein